MIGWTRRGGPPSRPADGHDEGARVEWSVSPHLQFRHGFPTRLTGNENGLRGSERQKAALQPLYDYVSEQSSA